MNYIMWSLTFVIKIILLIYELLTNHYKALSMNEAVLPVYNIVLCYCIILCT